MTPATDIFIETGNPFCKNSKAASYSRFILPFAYEIQGQKNAEALLKWEKVESNDLSEIHWRKQYFTSEVADVLFEKAKWYVLTENGYPFARSFTIKEVTEEKKRLREITVTMNPPQLVLFQKDSKSKSKFLNTGFLILEIYFPDGKKVSLDDLLFVNENLRYKEQIFEGHREKICNLFPTPNEVEKLFPENEPNKVKHYFDFWHYLLRQPVNGEGYLVKKSASIQSERPEKNRAEWDIYADARTFVWTCAVTKKGAETLQKYAKTLKSTEEKGTAKSAEQETSLDKSGNEWASHNYGHWVKLLNVDGSSGKAKDSHEQIRQFERDWAKERTYHRWEEKVEFPNSYYGFSYHSGAALISNCPEPPLWKHWGAMYFDMALLLFYLRVTLFRFSSELTKISSEAISEPNKASQIESWREKFNDLRWEFTLFTNLYQYPLISNQQQGLEMYELARKSLDINELFKEIQDEIQNGQEFIHKEVQNTQSETALRLNRIATIGLALSIVLIFLPLKFGEKFGDWLKGTWFVESLTNTEITDVFYSNDWLVIGILLVTLIPLILVAEYLWRHPIGWINRVLFQPSQFKIKTWLKDLITKKHRESKKDE